MKQLSAASVYQSAQENFGIVPPMISEIAAFSVPVAALYVNGVITMNASSFSEIEINAIELRFSSLNGCASCVKGHAYLARKAGLGEEDINAIINGRLTGINSLNRIIRAAEAIFFASREGFTDYITILGDDYTRGEIFELIGLLSLKTISNNINNYLAALKQVQAATV